MNFIRIALIGRISPLELIENENINSYKLCRGSCCVALHATPSCCRAGAGGGQVMVGRCCWAVPGGPAVV